MRWFQEASELIGSVALFVVMAVIFSSVIARQIFGFVIPDAFDFSRMFLGILVFWGIAGAVACQSLITADFLHQALGPRGQRILTAIGSLTTFVVLAILAWRLSLSVLDAYGNGIRTQDVGVPLWYFYGPATLAFLAALLFALRNIVLAFTNQSGEIE